MAAPTISSAPTVDEPTHRDLVFVEAEVAHRRRVLLGAACLLTASACSVPDVMFMSGGLLGHQQGSTCTVSCGGTGACRGGVCCEDTSCMLTSVSNGC